MKSTRSISGLLVKKVLDALPFGVSWATMPGAQIQYTNPAFDALVGYKQGHFETAGQLIEDTYMHEWQRVLLREHWNGFQLPPTPTGIIVLPEIEVDILGGDGQIRTAQHFGLILPDQKIAVAIYKDVSNAKRYNQTLKEYALLDPLTGVANRRGLQERWHDVIANQQQSRLAFLILDLDGFKPVNDTYGHSIGDEVLRVIARRLKGIIRHSDLVCRLGGDEFGLLLEAPDDFDQMEEICQRVTDAMNELITIEQITIQISASLGGCFYPDQAKTKRELIQRADMALYKIKRSGKGGWTWWTCPRSVEDVANTAGGSWKQ